MGQSREEGYRFTWGSGSLFFIFLLFWGCVVYVQCMCSVCVCITHFEIWEGLHILVCGSPRHISFVLWPSYASSDTKTSSCALWYLQEVKCTIETKRQIPVVRNCVQGSKLKHQLSLSLQILYSHTYAFFLPCLSACSCPHSL